MRHVLSVEQMRTADHTAINDYNIPGAILMENAGRSAAEYIIEIINELGFNNEKLNSEPVIDIICGSGNNGGDGFALARHLHELYKVRVFWIGEGLLTQKKKMSTETLSNFLSVEKLQIEIRHIETNKDLKTIEFSKDFIIDSMIGVGGSEDIKGIALEILKKLKKSTALKIAIDAPTGLNTLTGLSNPFCFEADFTITMYAEKIGMLINSGPDVCGIILTAYLGAPEKIVEDISTVHILENSDIRNIIPVRKRISSKFDYGKVLVLAGSKKYTGAGCLCANSAIISGSGLVHLYSTIIHPSLLPEVIPCVLHETESGAISKKAYKKILLESMKSDVIALGPGLSDDKETIELVKKLIPELSVTKKIVIDADGLRAIDKKSKLNKNVILTPHTGEFSKITGISRDEIERNSFELAKIWAKKLNCIIVLKHVPVIITDGNETFITQAGNPGMSSGGSGDVLTGLIAGFIAQGIEPLLACGLASFVQSEAADLYAEKYSQESLTASSLIKFIPEVMATR